MVEAPSGAETNPTSGDLRPLMGAYQLITPQARILSRATVYTGRSVAPGIVNDPARMASALRVVLAL